MNTRRTFALFRGGCWMALLLMLTAAQPVLAAESVFYPGFPRTLKATATAKKDTWKVTVRSSGEMAGSLQRSDTGGFWIFDENGQSVGLILPSNSWVPVGGATTRKTQIKPESAQLYLEMLQLIQTLP